MKAVITIASTARSKEARTILEAINNTLLVDCSQISVDDLENKDYSRFNAVIFHRFDFASPEMRTHVRELHNSIGNTIIHN